MSKCTLDDLFYEASKENTKMEDTTVLEDYQAFVDDHTSNTVKGQPIESWWACSGLMCEAAEVMELHEKALRKGGSMTVDPNKIMDELGDVLWYIGAVANANGLTLEEIMDHNISKLTQRVYETSK